jgi:hypothetical protein
MAHSVNECARNDRNEMQYCILIPYGNELAARLTSDRTRAPHARCAHYSNTWPIVLLCRRRSTIKCCSFAPTFPPIFPPNPILCSRFHIASSSIITTISSVPFTIMPYLCPLDFTMAGLPQYTAPSPSTCYFSPRYSDPPSLVTKSTQKPPTRPKPARYLLLDNEYDLFSPRNWAKDGFQIYPDEVDATMAKLRNSVVCAKVFGMQHFIESVPSRACIDNFLERTELYNSGKKRWREIPGVCTGMCQLIRPMRVLIDAIMEHFGYATTRPVVDAFCIPADCLEFDQPHRKPHREKPPSRIRYNEVKYATITQEKLHIRSVSRISRIILVTHYSGTYSTIIVPYCHPFNAN